MSNRLNTAQREAIQHVEGPCLVLAGAGSGKTRVITRKIAFLITDCGYAPGQIAALTFTNKAAREMRERVAKLLEGRSAEGLTVSTFHSLGVRILREEAQHAGLKTRFSILDAEDCSAILANLVGSVDRGAVRRVQQTISLWKNAMLSPDDAARAISSGDDAVAARVYRDYEATLSAYQAVDFDDLIRRPVTLFRTAPDVLEKWRDRLRYLLVDEYQDTNACQYELLTLIAGERAALTAVGDDDQAIYAWRGATLDNLARLGGDYPVLKVIKLEQNYRSTLRILQAANTLIANNPKLFEKRLWSEHGLGEPITVSPLDDEEDEAETVVVRLLAHKAERRGRLADYAILYRSNHQARIFEQALRRERVPYVLSGGQSFFDRAEIRDLLAYLRLLANDDDDPAFIRAVTTPKRGVGAQTLETLGKIAADRHASLFETVFSEKLRAALAPRQFEPLLEFCEFINRVSFRAAGEPAAQIFDDLLKAIGYEAYLYADGDERTARNRWQNVLDFREWIAKRGDEERATLVHLAQQIAILSMIDRDTEEPDAVRLSTLHAAKGLEFEHVFLVGVEEGFLPHSGSEDDTPADAMAARVEEERRLMYVGITRARASLQLTWCRKRKRAREWVAREPSRFIAEMGLDRQPPASAQPVSPKERLANLKALLGKGAEA